MDAHQKQSRKITYSYIAALVLVGFTAISGYIFLNRYISHMEADARQIEQSGKQRTYVQKIAKEALLLQQKQDSASFPRQLNTLQTTLREWEQAYRELQQGEPDGKTHFENSRAGIDMEAQLFPVRRQMFKAAEALAKSDTISSLSRRRQYISTHVQVILSLEPEVLDRRETITRLYRADAEAKTVQLRQAELAFTLLMLSMLLFQALYVFRPQQKRVNHFISELQQNIAEQVTTEEELRASEEELRASQEDLAHLSNFQQRILQHALVAIITTDAYGTITSLNRAARQWLEYQAEEMVGRQTPACLFIPEELSVYAKKPNAAGVHSLQHGFESLLSTVSRSGELTREWTLQSKSGKRLPVQMSMAAITDEAGSIQGYLLVATDISRIYSLRQELQVKEALYSSIIEHTRELVQLVKPDGRHIHVSPSCEQLLGYTVAELMEIPAHSLVHPEDNAAHVIPALAAASKKGSKPFEYRIRHKNGRYIWFETTIQPVSGMKGEVEYFQIESRDISQRKIAEQRLKESEARFRAISDASPLGIFVTSKSGELTYANRAYQQITGLNGSEARGEKWTAYIAPADLEALYTTWKQAVHDTGAFEYTYRTIHCGTGKPGWAWVKAEPIFEGSTFLGHVGNIQDITENYLAHERLTRMSALLGGVMDSSLSGIMAFEAVRDPQGHIIDFTWTLVNKKSEEMTGRTEADLLGKHLLEEMPGNKEEGLFDKYVAVTQTGSPVEFEHYYEHEGIKTWFLTAAAKLQDGFAVTFSNITARKNAEEEKERLTKQLQVEKFALDASVIVAITDEKGVITYVNDNFCAISGYAADELVGRTHQVVNSGYHPKSFFVQMWRQIASGHTWRGEICNKTKTGGIYWVDTTIVPYLDMEGKVYQYLTIRFDISSRKKLEYDLRRRTEELESFFTTALDLLCIANHKGRFVKMNKSWESVLGYTLPELEGASFLDMVHPEDLPPTLDKMGTLAAGEDVVNFTNRFRRKDGTYAYLEWRSTPKGEFIYSAARDVTERKLSEERLRASHRLINALFEHSPVAIQIFDKNGYSYRMNEARRQLLGLPSATYGVGQFNVLTDPLHQNQIGLHYKRAYAGEPVQVHGQCINLDVEENQWESSKHKLYYDEIIFPIKDKAGEVEAVVSLIQDITGQVHDKEALLEAKNFSETIIGAMPSYLYILDMDEGKLVYANEAFCKVIGYSLEEIQNKRLTAITQFIHEEDITKLSFHFQAVLQQQNKEVATLTYRIKNHMGHYRLLQGRDVVFKRNKAGKVSHILGSALDITETREAQAALQQTLDELQASEEELRQRGEELKALNENLETTLSELKQTQSHLIHSEKMASLGQLTAGIAHEINNPINFIHVGVSNLKTSFLDLFELLACYEALEQTQTLQQMQEAKKHLRQMKQELYYEQNKHVITESLLSIETGTSRTIEIVKGLRNFSRLDEAILKMADIHEGINHTLVLLSFQLKDKVKVVKEYDPHIPQIECFPGPLNQVFMNLISNAIQAMEDKGTLTIITRNMPGQVVITVRDTGKGIPEQIRTKIFDPFFTTKPVGQGTGLGLSISYGIIQKHYGHITVDSHPGQGTSFTIMLPKMLKNFVERGVKKSYASA